MGKRIIFVHGWGLSPDFWNALTPFFPEKECGFIDLGFVGAGEDLSTTENALYITHSLGTLWALKQCNAQMTGLVAINGFASFRRFASKDALAGMKRSLDDNPKMHMKNFWKNLNIAAPNAPLNVDKLVDGLDWLADWNARAELKVLQCPVLSLLGAQDKILPLPQMQKEWAVHEVNIHEDGGHMLPQTHPDWCAKRIKDYMS